MDDIYLATKVFENGRRNARRIADLIMAGKDGEISREEVKRRIVAIITDDARCANIEELEQLEKLVGLK